MLPLGPDAIVYRHLELGGVTQSKTFLYQETKAVLNPAKLDTLPSAGSGTGAAFRDRDLEAQVFR